MFSIFDCLIAHVQQIWLNLATSWISVFSPNMGKYGPEKTPYLDTFYAVINCGTMPEKINRTKKRNQAKMEST